jgi:hypothetical protein
MWIDKSLTSIDITHNSESGFGFGSANDEVLRFQTFIPSAPIHIRGIQLKLRKRFGSDQSDIIVKLFNAANNVPSGWPPAFATAIIESSLINSAWTIVNVPIASAGIGGPIAVVLGQREPKEARYEWAVGEVDGAARFGKWNGTNWCDESQLGDGWLRVWGHF